MKITSRLTFLLPVSIIYDSPKKNNRGNMEKKKDFSGLSRPIQPMPDFVKAALEKTGAELGLLCN
jgi:hypothetical protein